MSLWLASLFVALAPAARPVQAPAAAATAAAAASAPVTAVDRLAFLGASLTEGFGVQAEIGAPVWLGDVVRAALKRETPPPKRTSSLLFFVDPRGVGAKAASEALAADPTLVIALDYLFWFGYGEFDSSAARLASLDFGLAQLEPFRCPVLVGDLPDMRGALAGVPQMLQEKQVPDAAALAALNERLRAWAKAHANVVVFPLAELNETLRAGREFTLRGNTIFASELPELLQKDRLHPTAMGTIVTWIGAADALVRARRDIPATWFEWDRQQIYRRLYAAQEPARRQLLLERQKKYEREHPAPPPPPPPDPADEERKKSGRDG